MIMMPILGQGCVGTNQVKHKLPYIHFTALGAPSQRTKSNAKQTKPNRCQPKVFDFQGSFTPIHSERKNKFSLSDYAVTFHLKVDSH